jgi:acyl-homoserine lactone synthase
MWEVLSAADREVRGALFESMHQDRKRVFVDWLGWDLPHHGGLEIDAYDDAAAVYLVEADPVTGLHRGSVRLLRTDRGHILADLFPDLCEGPVPRGGRIREITRMCVSPDCAPEDRRDVRRMLATMLVRHAVATGIERYTAVTDMGFLSRVAAAGWRCRALGLPRTLGGQSIGAMMIEIDGSSLSDLRASGTLLDADPRRALAA